MKTTLVFPLLFFVTFAYAQDTTKPRKIDFKVFDRLAFVGTNFSNSLLLYLDGPRVLFNINKNLGSKAGLAFFPTMYYSFETNKLSPKLGVGARFDYKKIVVATPFYVVDGEWRIHAGIGYKF